MDVLRSGALSNPFRIDRRQSGGPVDRPRAAQQAEMGAADVVDDVAKAILLRHSRSHVTNFRILDLLDRFHNYHACCRTG